MANISSIKLPNNITYNIVDKTSGYTTNTGTVTSVAVSAGTGISVSGSPVTSNGTITIGHSNSVTAQTTQAVYPIKIDAQGHISSYGSAVNIPTQLVGTTVNTTPTQVQTALANNQNVEITYTDSTYGTFKFYDFIIAPSAYPVVCASAIMKYDNIWMVAELIGWTSDNSWHAYYTTVAETSNIPTKTSQLTNDSGFITTFTETDPAFSASAAAGITSTNINNWNAKATVQIVRWS